MRKVIASAPGGEQTLEIKGAGCLFYLFQKLFKLIDRWDKVLHHSWEVFIANARSQSMENV